MTEPTTTDSGQEPTADIPHQNSSRVVDPDHYVGPLEAVAEGGDADIMLGASAVDDVLHLLRQEGDAVTYLATIGPDEARTLKPAIDAYLSERGN